MLTKCLVPWAFALVIVCLSAPLIYMASYYTLRKGVRYLSMPACCMTTCETVYHVGGPSLQSFFRWADRIDEQLPYFDRFHVEVE